MKTFYILICTLLIGCSGASTDSFSFSNQPNTGGTGTGGTEGKEDPSRSSEDLQNFAGGSSTESSGGSNNSNRGGSGSASTGGFSTGGTNTGGTSADEPTVDFDTEELKDEGGEWEVVDGLLCLSPGGAVSTPETIVINGGMTYTLDSFVSPGEPKKEYNDWINVQIISISTEMTVGWSWFEPNNLFYNDLPFSVNYQFTAVDTGNVGMYIRNDSAIIVCFSDITLRSNNGN